MQHGCTGCCAPVRAFVAHNRPHNHKKNLTKDPANKNKGDSKKKLAPQF
jgi:hypothetical protein